MAPLTPFCLYPERALSNVLLPAPDGPMIAIKLPLGKVPLTLWRISFLAAGDNFILIEIMTASNKNSPRLIKLPYLTNKNTNQRFRSHKNAYEVNFFSRTTNSNIDLLRWLTERTRDLACSNYLTKLSITRWREANANMISMFNMTPQPVTRATSVVHCENLLLIHIQTSTCWVH